MPSPFPGMDPYLERTRWFRGFHNGLIFCLQDLLQPKLPAPYYALTGELVWLEGSERHVEPDVDVFRPVSSRRRSHPEPNGGGSVATMELETAADAAPIVVTVDTPLGGEERTELYLEIYARSEGGDRLITAIEVLSRTNKTIGGPGRQKYVEKQREILDGQVHLVEIDLLLGGAHTTAVPHEPAWAEAGPFAYHVSIHLFHRPKEFRIYPIRLEQRLPVIAIPLLPEDPAVTLDLQAAFQRVYDAGPYRRAVRYGEDPILPALTPAETAWAGQLLVADDSAK
jgi:Protein of unknown function (DUF4058)